MSGAAPGGIVAEVAALLSGADSPPPIADEDALVAFLVQRRLAAEVAALPCVDALSRRARRILAIERERTGAFALVRGRARQRCDSALKQAGVRALLLKGEAVVELTHGDPSRRPMADLDLLVSPADRPAAARALEGAGLARPGADTALHDVFVDPSTVSPGLPRGVAIEVHDDVVARPHPFARPDVAGAIARGASTAGLHAPRPEDALVLSALAFAFHETDGRKSWLALRDLALLARRAVDDALLAEASGRGGEAVAVRGLLLRAATLAGGPAPPGALDGARAETLRRRVAIDLLLREVDATLRPEPADRSLTRRFAAALWQPRLGATIAALAARLAAPGGGGAAARVSRHVKALSRLRRA